MKQRGPLQTLLRSWRSEVYKSDPLRTVRPKTWIIDDQKIKKLSTVLPSRIQMPSDIARLLGETAEWSAEWSSPIFDVVYLYDNPPRYLRSASPTPSTTSNTSVDDEPPAKWPKLMITIPPLVRRKTLMDITNAHKGSRRTQHLTSNS
jgi:hypothetical protein